MNQENSKPCKHTLGRRTWWTLFAWLGICVCSLSTFAAIPPKPADHEYFHDLAGIINAEDEQTITNIQQEVFSHFGVPIVVVTIRQMAEYDPESPSIESFARRWFDTWGIGTQANNSGMLIIVSIEDRKARIELGAEWGRRFDDFSQRLMDKKMVPQFKKGKYGNGVIAAVNSLAEIAKAGPRSEPPSPSLTDRILDNPVLRFNRQNNPIAKQGGSVVIILMVVVGLGCLIASIYVPQYRKPLLITGGVLVALALLFWIVVLILAVFLRGRGGGGDGGGFGGGSSGGGGASGSW